MNYSCVRKGSGYHITYNDGPMLCFVLLKQLEPARQFERLLKRLGYTKVDKVERRTR